MGVLSSIRGEIRCRYVLIYRASPEVVARLLPEPMQPAVDREATLVGLCYTRMREPQRGWLPLSMGTDHLSWRFPVEIPNGDAPPRRAVWVPRRNTSSRFGANWAGKLTPGNWSHSRFEFDEGPTGAELTVESDALDLHLVCRRTPDLRGSVFLEPCEVADVLRRSGPAHPPFALAPGFDRLELQADLWHLEPLIVDELRARRFDDPELFPPGSIELDCGLRASPTVEAHAHRPEPLHLEAPGATWPSVS